MCMYEGKEYKSDTGRFINKYDIWICDLGEPVNNNFGKKRPCVIIQSNKINDPKQGSYIIAPIRTEHQMEVSRETLQDIVNAKRKLGRIYIPIEFSENDFRFIDITLMRSVSSSEVLVYKNSIINPDLKKKINNAMYELLFSDAEDFNNTGYEEKEVSKIVQEVNSQPSVEKENTVVNETKSTDTIKHVDKPKDNRSNLPNTFIDVYEKVVTEKLTVEQAARKFNLNNAVFINLMQDYEKDEANRFNSYKEENESAKGGRPRVQMSEEFVRSYIQWKAKMINGKEAASQIGVPYSTFIHLSNKYKLFKINES